MAALRQSGDLTGHVGHEAAVLVDEEDRDAVGGGRRRFERSEIDVGAGDGDRADHRSLIRVEPSCMGSVTTSLPA